MFERRHEKLAHISVFANRMAISFAMASALIMVALAIGIVGYHDLAGFDWVDSFLEASMILGSMGPVSPLTSTDAKLFAACYALFSGLIFVAAMGVVLAPLTHRLLHKFHIDDQDLS